MTLEPEIRRVRRARELDRDTWAAPDKVDYKIRVESGTAGGGEATAGPFYFGRAFDAPPFFTFSATAVGGEEGVPQLTIGVEEWIQDEQNMYIGAMLWFKCKLCWEPVVTGGASVTPHPTYPPNRIPPQTGKVFRLDFEDWQSHPDIFGGPEGDEIIAYGGVYDDQLEIQFFESGGSAGVGVSPTGFFWPSVQHDHFFSSSFNFHQRHGPEVLRTHQYRKGTSIRDVLYGGPIGPYWFFTKGWEPPTGPGGVDDPLWKPRTPFRLSNANPKSGNWHIRSVQPAWHESNEDSYAGTPGISFATLIPCRTPVNGHIDEQSRPLMRADPGMTIWIGCDAMVNTEYDQGQSELLFFCEFYNKNGVFIGSGSGGWTYINGVREFGVESYSFLNNFYKRFDRQFYLVQDNGEPDPNSFVFWPGNKTTSFENSEYSNSDIYYVGLTIALEHNPLSFNFPYPEKIFDIDNITVDIEGPGGGNVLPTNFDVVLNFDGQVLKNYAGVHPLRSYEHPPKVVLS